MGAVEGRPAARHARDRKAASRRALADRVSDGFQRLVRGIRRRALAHVRRARHYLTICPSLSELRPARSTALCV